MSGGGAVAAATLTWTADKTHWINPQHQINDEQKLISSSLITCDEFLNQHSSILQLHMCVRVIIKGKGDEWMTGGKGGEKPKGTHRRACVTLVRWVWRAEYSVHQRRQVLISRTRRLAGEVDQIYKNPPKKIHQAMIHQLKLHLWINGGLFCRRSGSLNG